MGVFNASVQLRRRQIEEEELRKQREGLLSSDDSDLEEFVTARQRKKEKVGVSCPIDRSIVSFRHTEEPS